MRFTGADVASIGWNRAYILRVELLNGSSMRHGLHVQTTLPVGEPEVFTFSGERRNVHQLRQLNVISIPVSIAKRLGMSLA